MIKEQNEFLNLPHDSLLRFNDFISNQMGLKFSDTDLNELKKGVIKASKKFRFKNPDDYIQWLLSSPTPLSTKQIEVLSIYLTIGETYFFRDNDVFDLLANFILPQISKNSQAKKILRIWSTACSTGEEVYSIAIILDQNKQYFKNWDITILGTDINIQSLAKAKSGIYSNWSFRTTPSLIKNQYFAPMGNNQFEIKSHIKKKVKFLYLNLMEDIYPSFLNNTNSMDIIFCRNILMYFLPHKIKKVLQKLYRSMGTDGWLVVSPTDAFHLVNIECFENQTTSPCIFKKCQKTDKNLEEAKKNILSDLSLTKNNIKAFSDKYNIITTTNKSEKSTELIIEKIKKDMYDELNSQYISATQRYQEGNYPAVLAQFQNIINNKEQIKKNCFPLYGKIFALLARSYANLGQLETAINWCQSAIGLDKLNKNYHYLLVTILLEQGNQEDAIKTLKKCLYIDPDFILAHFTLGNILANKNETENSQRHLQIALSLLKNYNNEDIIWEEDHLMAGRLQDIIESTLKLSKEKIT